METIFPGGSFNSLVNKFSDFDITNVKLDELNKWKTHKVYDTGDNCNEKLIGLRWVFYEKYINSELNVKARLVAKWLEKGNSVLSDSPTCSKESMCLISNIIAASKWLCWSVDIKSAILQNRNNR